MSEQATAAVSTTTWNVDPVHSTAQFKVKHMMISNVKGEFTALAGVLYLDESDVTKSRVKATVDAASINTREAQRDAHLKSADFFDVEKHPSLTFRSANIARKDGDELTVTGDLTIHGITRKAAFQVAR